MIQSFAFCMSFLTLAHLTISAFAISPVLEPEIRLPIAVGLSNAWKFEKYACCESSRDFKRDKEGN